MAYLTEAEVRARAAQAMQRVKKSARELIVEASVPEEQVFDVFLSHSSSEPEEILLGVMDILRERHLTVYVDRYSDPQLSPDKVTKETAAILRGRMQRSKSLLYVFSQHSKKSRWMPWELGYFDGLKGNVAVLPVTVNQEGTFKSEEYLSLYPFVDIATIQNTSTKELWINESREQYGVLSKWVGTGRTAITKRS